MYTSNTPNSQGSTNAIEFENDQVGQQCATNNLIQCGVARYQVGDYRGAILKFNQEISANPDNAVAYNNRGVAKEKLLNYDGAIEDYNVALRLNPYYLEARNNLNSAKKVMETLSPMRK